MSDSITKTGEDFNQSKVGFNHVSKFELENHIALFNKLLKCLVMQTSILTAATAVVPPLSWP